MKKVIDFLLVLVLLAAIGYLVYIAQRNGSLSEAPTSASSASLLPTATVTFIPTKTLTPTLIPASVTIPTKTATFAPTQTLVPSRTPTSTTTPIASVTSTSDPVSPLDQEIKDGIARGNRIVQAIEAYHTVQGGYPSALRDVVPAYLSEIPVTSTGQAFYYRLFDSTGPMASEVYWLAFRAANQDHVSCTYMRRLDYWDCNYASP